MTGTTYGDELLRTLQNLTHDETGALLTMELILSATVISLGAIVGLTSIRDSVSQEFGDLSAGMASIDHGYGIGAVALNATIDNVTFDFSIAASNYEDLPNFCEPDPLDPAGGEPMCMEIELANPSDERSAP